MNYTSKSIKYAVVAFVLLFGIAIGNVQTAKAVKISITINPRGGKSGFQSCWTSGLICVIISANRQAPNGTTGGSPANAELRGNELQISFTPTEEMMKMQKDEIPIEVAPETFLDSDLCKLFGAKEIQVRKGTYKVKIKDGKGSLDVAVKASWNLKENNK